jgi:dUTP pyrophosphatase
VGLINHSDKAFAIERGDRVAQLMFMPVLTANLITSESLDETERGAGGFGSTGVK